MSERPRALTVFCAIAMFLAMARGLGAISDVFEAAMGMGRYARAEHWLPVIVALIGYVATAILAFQLLNAHGNPYWWLLRLLPTMAVVCFLCTGPAARGHALTFAVIFAVLIVVTRRHDVTAFLDDATRPAHASALPAGHAGALMAGASRTATDGALGYASTQATRRSSAQAARVDSVLRALSGYLLLFLGGAAGFALLNYNVVLRSAYAESDSYARGYVALGGDAVAMICYFVAAWWAYRGDKRPFVWVVAAMAGSVVGMGVTRDTFLLGSIGACLALVVLALTPPLQRAASPGAALAPPRAKAPQRPPAGLKAVPTAAVASTTAAMPPKSVPGPLAGERQRESTVASPATRFALLETRDKKPAGLQLSDIVIAESSIAERFQDVALIGTGASAKVYRAYDRATQRTVALKIMNADLLFDVVSLERFRREIAITRALEHPQIVAIYDVGRDAGSYYLVMELIEGETLAQKLQREGRLPVERAIAFVRDLLGVLRACHERGVVHRDLKPANVIIDGDGRVRLVDFGIARMKTQGDLTQAGATLGTPEYLAPELFAASCHDARSDLYAVGIMLFEMVSGRPPFLADSLAQVFRRHAEAPLPNLREGRSDVPDWVQDFATRLTAKLPFERYQIADEALIDLEASSVALRHAPRLARRPCLHCREATLTTLPLCVACGELRTAPAGDGDLFDVRTTPAANHAALLRFLKDAFGLTTVRLSKKKDGELVLSGLSAQVATSVKTLGQTFGVPLTLRKRSRAWLQLRFLTGVLVAVVPVAATIFAFALTRDYFRIGAEPNMTDATTWDLFCNFALFFGIAGFPTAFAISAYRAMRRPPLVATEDALEADVPEAYAWLELLRPALRAPRTPGMKAFVSQLIERYAILAANVRVDVAKAHPALAEVLRLTADIAPLASRLEVVVTSVTARETADAHAALLADRERARTPDDIKHLDARLRPLAAKMATHAQIEERYAALLGHLAFVQFGFNTLLGRALARNAIVTEAEIALLEAASARLRQSTDAAVAAEVELRRVA